MRSEDASYYSVPFGVSTDIPSPGDYNGDGKFDATVFRPSASTWFIARSTAGTQIVQFGANGDRPIPECVRPIIQLVDPELRAGSPPHIFYPEGSTLRAFEEISRGNPYALCMHTADIRYTSHNLILPI